MVADLSDLDLSAVPATSSFVELGLDSLFLTQLTQAIRARYGVKLTFRQIMGEFGTFATLADHLRPHVKPVTSSRRRRLQPSLPSRQRKQPPRPRPSDGYAALFAQQMQAMSDLMQRQLAVLAANGIAPPAASSIAVPTTAQPASRSRAP